MGAGADVVELFYTFRNYGLVNWFMLIVVIVSLYFFIKYLSKTTIPILGVNYFFNMFQDKRTASTISNFNLDSMSLKRNGDQQYYVLPDNRYREEARVYLPENEPKNVLYKGLQIFQTFMCGMIYSYFGFIGVFWDPYKTLLIDPKKEIGFFTKVKRFIAYLATMGVDKIEYAKRFSNKPPPTIKEKLKSYFWFFVMSLIFNEFVVNKSAALYVLVFLIFLSLTYSHEMFKLPYMSKVSKI